MINNLGIRCQQALGIGIEMQLKQVDISRTLIKQQNKSHI